jgi:hypothetical protein
MRVANRARFAPRRRPHRKSAAGHTRPRRVTLPGRGATAGRLARGVRTGPAGRTARRGTPARSSLREGRAKGAAAGGRVGRRGGRAGTMRKALTGARGGGGRMALGRTIGGGAFGGLWGLGIPGIGRGCGGSVTGPGMVSCGTKPRLADSGGSLGERSRPGKTVSCQSAVAGGRPRSAPGCCDPGDARLRTRRSRLPSAPDLKRKLDQSFRQYARYCVAVTHDAMTAGFARRTASTGALWPGGCTGTSKGFLSEYEYRTRKPASPGVEPCEVDE